MEPAPSIRHHGVVHAVGEGKAVIAVATGGCSSCGEKAGCGIGKLAAGGKRTFVELAVDAKLAPGDAVELEIAENKLLGAALLGYLLPAVGLVLGAALGQAVGNSDAAAAGGGIVGLVGALWLTRFFRPVRPPISITSQGRT